jgi:hypothetical protein
MVNIVRDSLDSTLKDEPHIAESLNKCLVDIATQLKAIEVVDPPLFCILKTFNEKIVEPAAQQLREEIYEKIPYKEVKNSWALYLTLYDAYTESSGEVRKLNVKDIVIAYLTTCFIRSAIQ